MAHPTLHIATGTAIGSIALLPFLANRWRSAGKLAQPIGVWLSVSWVLGCFACIPEVLSYVGLPPSFTDGWWMNIFVFNPLLDRIEPEGMLKGELSLVFLLGLQFTVIAAAIYRTDKIRKEAGQSV